MSAFYWVGYIVTHEHIMEKERLFERLFYIVLCLFFVLFPSVGNPASVQTTIDAKYTRTDTAKTDQNKLNHEYNPRISIKYSYPLTEWTDLSGEGKFNYKKEDKRSEEDTETREPQIELRLKSLIYDFKTGYKETWNRNQTEKRAFGHFLLQPLKLPELRFDYDHDEKKGHFEKDKITLGTIYKPSSIFRVKLDLKHEYTDYEDDPDNEGTKDLEDLDLSAEVKMNHTLSTRRPIKVELSYKVESLYQEEKDIDDNPTQDEILQTLRGKVTYQPTNRTDMSLEYENKTKDDDIEGQDNTDRDIQFDISQKLADWLTATGRLKNESKEERVEDTTEDGITDQITSTGKDTDKKTLEGRLEAMPTDWFKLRVKAINEKIEESDPNITMTTKDKDLFEVNLTSQFPSDFFNSQSIEFENVKEDKEGGPYSEENNFLWKFSIAPLRNLSLNPEYNRSITKKIKEEEKDVTDEYRINVDYEVSLNDRFNLDLSHLTDVKDIETHKGEGEISDRRERNDDTTFEIDFQPYEALFLTTEITRKDKRISGEPSHEEMSYTFQMDWSFNPFTWSLSYKYIDNRNQSDEEMFESKLICDFSDYTIEGEYKFNQTFSQEKDKEDIITLRIKAVF